MLWYGKWMIQWLESVILTRLDWLEWNSSFCSRSSHAVEHQQVKRKPTSLWQSLCPSLLCCQGENKSIKNQRRFYTASVNIGEGKCVISSLIQTSDWLGRFHRKPSISDKNTQIPLKILDPPFEPLVYNNFYDDLRKDKEVLSLFEKDLLNDN